MKQLSFEDVIKKLGNKVVSHDTPQIVVTHQCANTLDEWLEKQDFAYDGRGIDMNTHIYSRRD